MILVSHDPFDGLSLADQMVVIRRGKVLQQDHPQQIIHQPANAYVAELLAEANIIAPAQAESWLGLQLKADECLAVYPFEIGIAEKGISAKVRQVRYQISYDELDVKVDGYSLTLNAPSGKYKVGDELFLKIDNQRIVGT
jgi:ABC-type Fe3+/spermidine/putrescine transport system ATPase subunit